MRNRVWLRAALVGALVMLSGAASAGGRQAGAIPALATVEKGKWQLRDGDGGTREICLKDPQLLVQLFHGGMACEHFLIDAAAGQGTARYVCPGHGKGMTSVRVETPRLLSVDTQGVIDGTPFSQTYEGRRIGDCS